MPIKTHPKVKDIINQTIEKLSFPDCEMGYTEAQCRELFGSVFMPRFQHWMVGQTAGLCSMKKYNHEKKAYEPTSCKHGESTQALVVYFTTDVIRYIKGLPIID